MLYEGWCSQPLWYFWILSAGAPLWVSCNARPSEEWAAGMRMLGSSWHEIHQGPPPKRPFHAIPGHRDKLALCVLYLQPNYGPSVSQGLFMWDYFIIVLNMPKKIRNIHSFRHESYMRVQTAPITKVLMTSQGSTVRLMVTCSRSSLRTSVFSALWVRKNNREHMGEYRPNQTQTGVL